MEHADTPLSDAPPVPTRQKDTREGRDSTIPELGLASEALDEMELTMNPFAWREVFMRSVPGNAHPNKIDKRGSLLRPAKLPEFLSSDSFASAETSSVPTYSLPHVEERKQKLGSEIAEVREAARRYVAAGAGDIKSTAIGDTTQAVLSREHKDSISPASTGQKIWNKLRKRLQGKPLPSTTPVSRREDAEFGKPLPVREERKQVGLIGSLRGLFLYRKKNNHPWNFRMCSFGGKHGQHSQNEQFPMPNRSPVLASSLSTGPRMDKRKSESVDQHYQHRGDAREGQRSGTALLDTRSGKSNDSSPQVPKPSAGLQRSGTALLDTRSGKSNDSSLQLPKPSAGLKWDDSIKTPLLKQPYFRKLEGSRQPARESSARASASLSGSGPWTAQVERDLWTLRTWKLRHSPKCLRIDPATELLFHYDADKKWYACSIKLENRSDKYVAFKFKCSSPEGYMMKPRHGVLAPNIRIEVKGFTKGKPLLSSKSRKNRDLFTIITLPLPADMTNGKPMRILTSIVITRISGRLLYMECAQAFLVCRKHLEWTNDAEEPHDGGGGRYKDLQSSLGHSRLFSIPEDGKCDF